MSRLRGFSRLFDWTIIRDLLSHILDMYSKSYYLTDLADRLSIDGYTVDNHLDGVIQVEHCPQ